MTDAIIHHVPYTHFSSDNGSALSSSKYSKNINFYGRLKLCLYSDVSVMTNRSRRFKCLDVTVTANCAEGLTSALDGADLLASHHSKFTPDFLVTTGQETELDLQPVWSLWRERCLALLGIKPWFLAPSLHSQFSIPTEGTGMKQKDMTDNILLYSYVQNLF
jgi:hypothetical protein